MYPPSRPITNSAHDIDWQPKSACPIHPHLFLILSLHERLGFIPYLDTPADKHWRDTHLHHRQFLIFLRLVSIRIDEAPTLTGVLLPPF